MTDQHEDPVPTHPGRVLLPPNLSALAQLTSKDVSRPGLNAVYVEQENDHTYTVTSTDGCHLTQVRVNGIDPDEFPDVGRVPNDSPHTTALVPADLWKNAYARKPKNRGLPVLDTICLTMGEETTTLISTDPEATPRHAHRRVEGKFPAYQPLRPSGTPQATVYLDAHLLARVFGAWSKMGREEHRFIVALDVYGSTQPVQLRATRETQEFWGLIMPCRE